MTHGNIGAWGKQEGDEIAAGDIVCEVETDKAVRLCPVADTNSYISLSVYLVGFWSEDTCHVHVAIFVKCDGSEKTVATLQLVPSTQEIRSASGDYARYGHSMERAQLSEGPLME